MQLTTLVLVSLVALTYGQFSLPPLTGPNLVGTVSLELVDQTRLDPLSPTPKARDLMISVFYPVQHVRIYKLAPDFDPLYAEYLTTSLGIPPGILQGISSQAYARAYLHPPDSSPGQPNIILFSPGAGNSREDYTATMSNLASLGYIVIGVDHPYDTSFIAYPGNRTLVVEGNALANSTDPPALAANYTTYRAADFISVLDALGKNETFAKQIPGVHGRLDVSHVGIVGHSLGGAAAATAMSLDSRFECGSNLDGTFWGNVTALSRAIKKPFLTFSSDGHNRTTDPSFGAFLDTNPREKFLAKVEGAAHGTFADFGYLYDVAKAAGIPLGGVDVNFGTIGGERLLRIVAAYLGVFFDTCFRRGDVGAALLDVRGFPEVNFG